MECNWSAPAKNGQGTQFTNNPHRQLVGLFALRIRRVGWMPPEGRLCLQSPPPSFLHFVAEDNNGLRANAGHLP
jgi:hypothetical protein